MSPVVYDASSILKQNIGQMCWKMKKTYFARLIQTPNAMTSCHLKQLYVVLCVFVTLQHPTASEETHCLKYIPIIISLDHCTKIVRF